MRILVMAVTALVIAAAAYAIDQPAAGVGLASATIAGETSGAAPRVGEPAPDFEVTTVAGESIRLGDFRGDAVWLTFGASWCADCRAEYPDLQATYQHFRDRGLVVLGIVIEEDDRAARDYAERVGLTFTMAADPTANIARRYHILGIPTHFFIGRDGTVREVRLGRLQLDDMERLVRQIVH